jgi:hypothetical protein
MGGPARQHGAPLRCADEATWAGPSPAAAAGTAGHGPLQVTAWERVHPKLCKDAAWHDHRGKVPVIEGTVIQLRPGRLPGSRELKPMWLWASDPAAGPAEVAVLWQACLRRFDLERSKPGCCHKRGCSSSAVPSGSGLALAA